MEKQKKLLIYHHCLAEAGGCETFIYNLCTMLRNWYNILVVYDDGHHNQINRNKSIVNTEKKIKGKIYEGDIVIQNSMWCMFDKGMVAPRVIGTDTSGISDIVENGKNGYLVPLDMKFDINIIKKIPKVENFTNGVNGDTWKDYLGGAVYLEKEKQKPFEYDDEGYRRQVKALIQTWFDEEKVNANVGTTFFVRSEERLKYLLKNHMVKLL